MIEFNLEAKLAQEAAREQYKKDFEILSKEYEVKYNFSTDPFVKYYSDLNTANLLKSLDDIGTS